MPRLKPAASDQKTTLALADLRHEITAAFSDHVQKCADRYQFELKEAISELRSKPLILLLGNYSTGKSTLVNEFLGGKIQETGQAPTDDAFTLITSEGNDEAAVGHEGPGPLEILRRHDPNLVNHFRVKKIANPKLENLSIIDTPGMLDSADEGRPYDYPMVIADLCAIADLIVFLFDPHKTATVKESCDIVETVVAKPGIDARTIYVLNRVDDCEKIGDLIRVYGSLCWNLSRLTRRKDIPRILMCYAETADSRSSRPKFLADLTNQRGDLLKLMEETPRSRLEVALQILDRQAGQLEATLHGARAFLQIQRSMVARWSFLGMLIAALIGLAGGFYAYVVQPFGDGKSTHLYFGGSVALVVYILWLIGIFKLVVPKVRRAIADQMETLKKGIPAESQVQWEQVKDHLEKAIRDGSIGRRSSRVRKDLAAMTDLRRKKVPAWLKRLGN